MKKNIKKTVKFLILCVVVVLLLSVMFFLSSGNKKVVQQIQLTDIKSQYGPREDIILSGTAVDNSKIVLTWDKKIGITKADSNGRWNVNLGKMPEGKYAFQAVADDSAKSQSILTAEIVVQKQKGFVLMTGVPKFLTASILSTFQKAPEKIIWVPESAPEVLQGNWNLIKN